MAASTITIPPVMTQVRAAGIHFGCWGAHDGARIDRALQMGVKVFTTDRPSLVIARRAAHQMEAAQ